MKRLILAAAIAVFAVSAYAQPMPPGKWWRRPEIVKELQLTADQQSKLDNLFAAAADELIDTKAEVDKNQVALRAELERSAIRRAEVQKIIEKLNDARGHLFAREMMLLVDMRSVLAEQQWRKMRAKLDQMAERRGERRGGPPPPRP